MTTLTEILNSHGLPVKMKWAPAAELLKDRGVKLCHIPGKGFDGFYTLPLTPQQEKSNGTIHTSRK